MITYLDWPVVSIYILVILFVAWFLLPHKSYRDKKILSLALLFHILGGLAFAFVYQYYYGNGDTMYYFSGGSKFLGVLFENPETYFELFFSNYDSIGAENAYYVQDIQYFRSNELWMMVRISSVFTFLGANLFLPTTVLMSVIGFIANWKIYEALKKIVQEKVKYFYVILFLPSVIFWGNGLMKDTVVFFSVGYGFWLFSELIYKRIIQFSFEDYLNILLVIFLMYLTYILKSYVALIFIMTLFVVSYFSVFRSIESIVMKIFISLSFITILVFLALALQNVIFETLDSFQDETVDRLKGFHSWHTEQGGSTYSLGEIEYTATGLVKKIPAALNVTYFRPYLWEVKTVFMLVTALESLIFFGIFIYFLISFKGRKFLTSFKNPLLLFSLLFFIIFGFIVGLTSYNFGALARYKLICLPFFTGWILILINYFKGKLTEQRL